MSRKWYGSINNRLEENRMFCKTIEVGTGMTEYLWSDSHAYEVVEVTDQKHIKVREYDHEAVGEKGFGNNNWKLISNENNPVMAMSKRGNYWYWTVTVTAKDVEEIESNPDAEEKLRGQIWLCNIGVNKQDVLTKGKVTKYHRANVSFGVAQYYYDYEF